MSNDDEQSLPAACPVDPAARAAWLEKSKQTASRPPVGPWERLSEKLVPVPSRLQTRPLSEDREISTIPRADPTVITATPNPSSKAANKEQETGADSKTGNWMYPSERMFFEAMKRKNYSPDATDMNAIVPIHNAVNERAWSEIKQWETRFGWSREENKSCGGPRLHSFSGDSKKLSPKARLNSLLGYQEPFDRHDWVVERCPGGGKVEYVIDFYAGRKEEGKALNFYLDVRPKLNSWEGWKMRLGGMTGYGMLWGGNGK
ncbi:MAG: Cytochrome c1 heme lyase [Icmadophila ericetorum]|nr:Cytochrome c1 heme lyase [Icmadophila ericetorum]